MKIPIIFLGPENPAHQDINSYSAERFFSSVEGLMPSELRTLAGDTVRAVATGCDAAGAKDVSHVKAYIEYASGFLHADTVSGSGGISVAGRDGEKAQRFRLVINAVIYGLPEASIKMATEQALETVRVQYGLNQELPSGKQY